MLSGLKAACQAPIVMQGHFGNHVLHLKSHVLLDNAAVWWEKEQEPVNLVSMPYLYFLLLSIGSMDDGHGIGSDFPSDKEQNNMIVWSKKILYEI